MKNWYTIIFISISNISIYEQQSSVLEDATLIFLDFLYHLQRFIFYRYSLSMFIYSIYRIWIDTKFVS